MYAGRVPLGFGTSASLFPTKTKSPTPGTGNYDPKLPANQVKGGTFDKSTRFQAIQEATSRQQLHIKEVDASKRPLSHIDTEKLS